ncbi:MAG: hypothetical protein CME68_05505 [Halobacteriovoraceae bacterium]|nr:hypothetical protein [Halobacteriovoraceae bacterium]
MNQIYLNKMKKDFISALIDKCFEFDAQIRSLKKYHGNGKGPWPLELTKQKEKALKLLSYILRIYRLELSHKLKSKEELRKELSFLKNLQKSLKGSDLMTIYCEEVGRWILKEHPTFYAGSLRIIKDLDTQETLLNIKKAA